MSRLLSRVAVVGLAVCFLVPTASLAQSGKKSNYDLRYRYAYRRLGPNGSETDIMNWNGNINWDKHSKESELWIGKDSKTYLITDKSTMDAFEKAFGPLRDFNLQRGKYMDGYYEARGQQRSFDRQSRSLDRRINSLKEKRNRAKDDDARKDIDDQIQDLQKEKDDADRQAKDWSTKLDAETKKREEFYSKREDIRADVYKKIDKIVDDAFAKGLAKPADPA